MLVLEVFSQKMNRNTETSDISLAKLSAESPVLHVTGFHYDLEYNRKLATWFEECEDAFRNDLANISVNEKAKLLMRKLETTERLKFIHPRIISNLGFD